MATQSYGKCEILLHMRWLMTDVWCDEKGSNSGKLENWSVGSLRKLSKVKSEWWRKRVSHACDRRQSIQLESGSFSLLFSLLLHKTRESWHNLAAFRLNNKMYAHSIGKCIFVCVCVSHINRCISLFGSRIQWRKWSAHICRTQNSNSPDNKTKKYAKPSIDRLASLTKMFRIAVRWQPVIQVVRRRTRAILLKSLDVVRCFFYFSILYFHSTRLTLASMPCACIRANACKSVACRLACSATCTAFISCSSGCRCVNDMRFAHTRTAHAFKH